MSPWVFLYQRCRPYRWSLLAGLAGSLVQSALAVPVAILLKRIFDHTIPQSDFSELVWIGLALLGLRTLGTAVVVGTRLLNLNVTGSLMAQLRRELLQRTLLLPRAHHQKVGPDHLINLLTNESSRADLCLHSLLSVVIPSTATAVALAVVLMGLNLRLFLVMLLVWPFTWVLNEMVRRRAVATVRIHNATFARFSGHVRWFLESMDPIRIHNTDGRERQRSEAIIGQLERQARPVQLLQTLYVQTQLLLMTCISVVVLLVGGEAVSTGKMSIGELLAFYTVVGLLNTALRDFSQGMYHVFVGFESISNLIDLLFEPAPPPYTGKDELQLQHSLRLEQVQFGYDEQRPLLQGVDLCLTPGQIVALVGSNGSGKSTVLALLLGFYRPTQGRLKADEVDYDLLDLGGLRAQIGVVSQEPWLFAGSIRDNLNYGQSEPAGDEQLWQVLGLTAADEWVAELPDKLDTRVGERGDRLSGGQRQRLAISRALLGQPRFLFLDEPTNHLDAQAIATIFGRLRELPNSPAVLLITHDQNVAGQCDQVWTLSDGRLELTRDLSATPR